MTTARYAQFRGSHVLSPTRRHSQGDLEVHLLGRGIHDGLGKTVDPAAREWIAPHVLAYGVSELFAINGSEFNAEVVDAHRRHFAGHSLHPGGVEIHFNAFVGEKKSIDGVAGLRPGQGAWICSGGCPTGVITGEYENVVTHCGFKSLVAEHWRPDSKAPRGRPSVLENAFRHLVTDRGKIEVSIICGVGPESYVLDNTHSVHGPYNAILVNEVRRRWGPNCIRDLPGGKQSISLPDITTAQLLKLGVLEEKIEWDEIDTATETDLEGGGFTWYHHGRPGESMARNHILVLYPNRE